MKTLYLLRHAEAATGSPSGQDHDRPLTAQGEQQAANAAAYMLENGHFPALIVASDARRTQQTAEAVVDAFGIADALAFTPEFYLAPAETLLEEIGKADDSFDSMLVVAHNPGLAELAFKLSGGDEKTLAFHPATLAVFTCDIDQWNDITPSTTQLQALHEN